MSYATPRLRPLGVGDLLDEVIRLYRNHFLLLAGISAVVVAPLALLEYLWRTFLVHPETLAHPGQLPSIWAESGVWSVLSWLANVAVNLAITYAVSEIYLGRKPTVGSAFAGGLGRFGSAAGLAILLGLAAGLMAVTIVGIPFAIYFGVCWILSFQAFVLEGLGIRVAMSRSRALVRGNWWRVLGIAVLIGIIGIILALVIGLLGGALDLVLFFARSSGFGLALLSVLSFMVNVAAEVFTTPIWYCGAVLLYYDLRVRKEGFDLELMAREMGAPPAPPPIEPAQG